MPRSKRKSPKTKRGTAAPDGPLPRVVHAGQLTRIEHIHERLRLVRPGSTLKVTAQSLATELSRSINTIYRDLEALKEKFGAPVDYDPVRGTQFYDQLPGEPPFELRPRVWLDASEALALMIGARRLFPFGPHIEAALKKLLPLVDRSITLDPATLESVCSTPETPATETDVRHFELLFNATVRRQEVQLVYQKLTADAAPEIRIVHPLHLVLFSDLCLLVAHEPACNERRNFELTRLSEPRLTGRTFTPPADFDLKAYLAGGMGPFLGEPRHEVRVRFAPSYVPYVRKHPWHRPQLLVQLPDGSAEAIFRVAHTGIIEQRVLAAAGQVVVLDSPDVRARIHLAAQALLTQHQ